MTTPDHHNTSPKGDEQAQVNEKADFGSMTAVREFHEQEAHLSYTPEEERRVLRKIDVILLPLLCGCYIFSVSQRLMHTSII